VIETVEQITTFTQTNLIGQIKQTFATLPDARSGDGIYQKYDMSDEALRELFSMCINTVCKSY
jgi:hypothetical protein